jgi:hypothetical protein
MPLGQRIWISGIFAIFSSARPWMLFSLKGPGRWLGDANEVDAISGVAAINLQATGRSGEIQVSADAAGLLPGTLRTQVF